MSTLDADRPDNDIFLRGRLAADPELRELPSGDELCSFRLTVARPAGDRSVSRATVDSIDCATAAAKVRRCLDRATPGDELEVSGRLHRRFWRTPGGGVNSRYEVMVTAARSTATLRRRRSDASAGRTPASA